MKKEKKVEQELVRKVKNEVASPADLSAWGEQEVTSKDIIIPRLLIMQGMSDMVTDGKAKIGDIVENLGETVLGGVENGVEILPFKCEKLHKIVGANGKTLAVEPVTAATVNAPYECEYEGEAAKRFYTLMYYVLLPAQLEVGNTLPYVLEFKSTALRAGKKIFTQMYTTNRNLELPPPAKTFMLETKKESNSKGTYAVPDVKVMRDTSEEELKVALQWFNNLKEGGARVAEEEV